jgi:adenosylmethionine-8-amino-7-oxononanoate aminotransferase
VFNAAYAPLLFDVGRIPFPAAGREQETYDALERACLAGSVAAFVAEPLILGAGGMLIYGPSALREMRAICAKHDVLFIADEVMTGFGRTGTLFACEQGEVSPDILCLAKGLTGGSLPLAVTLCTETIFEAHLSQDRARTFFHSSSYTANPIACAAAAANLDIWRNEPVKARIASLAASQTNALSAISRDPRLSHLRQLGTIAAFELTGTPSGYLNDVALSLRARLLKRNVLLRPLGTTIYVMPPYCSTEQEIGAVYGAIIDTLDEVRP